jgi:hypothetical protein
MTLNYIFLLPIIYSMNIRQFLLLNIFFPLLTFGQFDNKKLHTISKCQIAPKIDGILNDNTWRNLDIASEFTQSLPNNGIPERNQQRTEVKICYDSKNIYFGIMMYDNAPDSILKELTKRDNLGNSDAFIVYINPFNDGQIEYQLIITAAGVQGDAKISPSTNDPAWNAVWKSSVKINEKGWVAELAIPFSQLRFPNNNKAWAINMQRTIKRYREDYTWNPINVEYSNMAIQAGLIQGIKDVNSPVRLSFMPYTSVYTDMYDGETNLLYNYGMDLKYGINESFTLDMTLIPDFGQVAADDRVLNLSPFEVKYEEKRQFFNEGTELFNKGGDMFYSRRLQDDLLNASKITGRTKNGLGVAILNAVTNQTEQDPLTNYNVMIFDQSFGNSSSVSLMNTQMIQKGNQKDANVTGIFTRINNKENTHTYTSKLKMSQEFEGTNLTTGFAGMFAVENNKGNYRYKLFSILEDDKYNPNDLGFLYANNEITNGIDVGYEQLTKNKKFIFRKHYLFVRHKTLFTDNKFVNLEIEAENKFMLNNYLFLMLKIVANPYEKDDYYEARSNDLSNPVKRSKSINVGGYMSSDYRNKFALDFGTGGIIKPLYSGHEFRWRISPRYRFNDKISIVYVLSLKNRYNDIGYINDFVNNENISKPILSLRNTNMITNVFRGNYIVNNKIDLSLKLRYHIDQVQNLKFQTLNNNGYLKPTSIENTQESEYDINYTTWTSDIALNWRFAPGSQLSLVWKNAIDNEDNMLINHWTNNVEESFNLAQQNSVSLKVIYYLDYLYLRK